MNFFSVLLLITSLAISCESAKILGIYTTFSKSHTLVGQNLFKALARRGHEVTVVSPFPLDKPLKNYHEFTIPITVETSSMMNSFIENSASLMVMLKAQEQLTDMTMQMANDTINSPRFQKMMQDEQFDVVMLGYFMNEFLVGLSAHFECPLIIISATKTMKLIDDMVGNPSSVAATPQLLINSKEPMSFMQRVINMLIFMATSLMGTRINWKAEVYYNYNFPPEKYPTYEVAKQNTSLILSNHWFAEGITRPNLPNVIEVGGLQIKEQPDPLPENIQKWLDDAEHGVIYFSLGSNVKSSSLSEKKLRIFLDVFAKINLRVLWKWEIDELPGQLPNVMTSKWLPQDDILAHKNVKLFITHGGKGSLAECKYHGVPILGIPFFGDQMVNIDDAMAEGWALRVDYATLSYGTFIAAINELVENPKYTEVIKRISSLYRDRPVSGLETATFWTEYVIRHKGAPHMRYPGVDLNFFQYHSLDVVGFLLLVTYVVFKVTVFLMKIFCRLVCCRNSSNKLKKQ